jgi:capsular polysaccharide biosynthesis protein
MRSVPHYRAPTTWLHWGKYLFPLGLGGARGERTAPPQEQVAIAQLARDYPESVLLSTCGAAECLPEFAYDCHESGRRESRRLPARFVPPAFVAQLQGGMSFGRHCAVIGPAGKAVRETGYNLNGQVRLKRQPISQLRLQHWRHRWAGDVTSRPWLPRKQRIDGRVAVLNTRCSHNFYHWLTDVLPRLVPLRQLGLEAKFYLVESLAPFQQGVLAALGIRQEQLIQPHCRLLLEAEELLVPSLPTPACLREFSRMLASALEIDGPVRSPRRIFISRRQSGKRALANEAELEKLLESQRIETHYMEDYPLAKQARLVRESEVIVAVHGAGLANLMFARPQTSVIEIIPAGRYNDTCFPKKSCIFGLRHQVVFAEPVGRRQKMRVLVDDVAAALRNTEFLAARRAA